MPKAIMDEAKWATAKALYESGVGTAMIAKEFGISQSTVSNHKKKAGWTQLSERPSEVPDEPGYTTVNAGWLGVTPTITADDDPRVAELLAITRKLQEENEELARQLDDARPVKNINLPETDDEITAYFGEDHMNDLVESRLTAINQERMRRGSFPIDFRTQPDVWERARKEAFDQIRAARTLHTESGAAELRVVKMFHAGSIVQVPYERQMNNEVAQPGTALWKMRDKGAKLVMPLLCQKINCWLEAEAHPDGTLIYGGYCSPAHMATDPYQGEPVAGVSTRRPVGAQPRTVIDMVRG